MNERIHQDGDQEQIWVVMPFLLLLAVSLPHPLTPLSLLQHFFTSFGARDRCFLLIFRLWQNALLEKVSQDKAWTGCLGDGPGDTIEPGMPELRKLEGHPALLHGHQA